MKYIKIYEEYNFDGFKEFTFQYEYEDENNFLSDNIIYDVMMNIMSDGTVIDIYCYKDGIPINPKTGKKIITKKGKNDLFVHINVNKKNLEYILRTSFIIVKTEDDLILLEKMISKYKLEGIDTRHWDYEE